MANCSNCAAPLPEHSHVCEYCGSRNDVDLKGIHYFTTNESETPRICPRCSITLQTVDLKVEGRFLIERCDRCLGLFFDPGELEALLQATVTNVYTINRQQLGSLNTPLRRSEYEVSYVKCPVCTKIMNRVNFGAKSGVIVDRCREHGIWLDGGELRHLFEWMKAGGKLLEQERQEQRRQETERALDRERSRNGPQTAATGYRDFDSYGEILRHDDPDLFDLVRSVLRIFR